jgi:NAD(P)-dependent dehydrogenase (short-subunit alcohol dehydrogenase family)
MSSTVLITGASSGIGYATAMLFQSQRWNVIASMRSPEREIELNALENKRPGERDGRAPRSDRRGQYPRDSCRRN